MSKKRIVVTGIGILTALGHNIDEYWNNLLAGKSGIRKITRFDASTYPSQVAAEVDFDPTVYIDPKEVKRNDRFTHFALAASKLALQDSKLDLSQVDKTRLGVLIASGIGGMETIESQSGRLHLEGPRRVSPFMIPSLIANIASGIVAIELGAMGPNYGIVTACAASSHAIGQAYRALQYGDADIMFAGGSEAAITRLGFAGFCAMRAMSTHFNEDPTRSSRPFDAKRDGFVMGEGAGVLILETLEHAMARKAPIYAEVAGYAATCDAFHITMPDEQGAGMALCLNNLLKDANLKPEDVQYINAHGTSTPYNDKFETLSIKKVFGEHAYKLKVSSTKSMTGHLLGAAGAIEAAAAIKAIQTGWIPPTINLDMPDADCDLDYVPHKAIQAPVEVAISENLGFGGHNAALAFKAYKA
jgi:3-oxoacyl-[acyl-carrier-protein] synthase II